MPGTWFSIAYWMKVIIVAPHRAAANCESGDIATQ